MKATTRIFGILFVLLSVFEIVTLSLGVTSIHPWIKPLLIPALAAAALCALLPEHRGWQTALLANALLLHTVGDILLLFNDPDYAFFEAGLRAFLVGNICYVIALIGFSEKLHGWKEILLAVCPLVIAPLIASQFKGAAISQGILVVYAFTLLYLVSCGGIWLLRKRRFGWRVLVGGLFFIASDVLLALNAFNGVEFPLRHATVMGTCLIAEWLLVSAIVRNRLQSAEA